QGTSRRASTWRIAPPQETRASISARVRLGVSSGDPFSTAFGLAPPQYRFDPQVLSSGVKPRHAPWHSPAAHELRRNPTLGRERHDELIRFFLSIPRIASRIQKGCAPALRQSFATEAATPTVAFLRVEKDIGHITASPDAQVGVFRIVGLEEEDPPSERVPP